MAKNKNLCWDCQSRLIDYRTSITGVPLKHGLCRECFELQAAKRQGTGGRLNMGGRTQDQKEDTHETKYGIDR